MAAFYAALRGQASDYQSLKEALETLQSTELNADGEQEAKALTEFYLTMAKASHNMVLLHVMRTMQPMLIDNIQRNLSMLRSGADVEQSIQQQRKDIVDAIVAGDPVLARSASHKHLGFIEQTLLDINQRDANVQRSLRRIICE
jgi:GntR family transcriptional repressor for pyruvate dehydrogenase complex